MYQFDAMAAHITVQGDAAAPDVRLTMWVDDDTAPIAIGTHDWRDGEREATITRLRAASAHLAFLASELDAAAVAEVYEDDYEYVGISATIHEGSDLSGPIIADF